MPDIWFTSDLHIGHRLVAASRCTLPNGKPMYKDLKDIPDYFGDFEIAAIDRILAEHWDAQVKPDDHVYMLGDLCSGTDKAFDNALMWLSSRPGRIHWIAGNHCPVHPMQRDAGKYQRRALEIVEEVHPYLRRRVPLLGGGHTDVLLCHFPYRDRYTGIGSEGRYKQYRMVDEGMPIVHGHTHSKKQVSYSNAGTLQLHVGVDAWGGRLVPLSWLTDVVSMHDGIVVAQRTVETI